MAHTPYHAKEGRVLCAIILFLIQLIHANTLQSYEIKSFRAPSVSTLNPLSPHDALKHHFTSMKTYLIFQKQRV